jgi:electron transfer flavoprotein beta subunit
MKVAVCLKQVPSREWHPRIAEGHTWVREEDASFELNEADGYALEAGLGIREQHGGEVVAIVAGPPRVAQVARDALARGADRAVHVALDRLPSADGLAVARCLADAVAPEGFDLVLTGTQSDDAGSGVTGIGVAEYLGIPHASLVLEMHVDGDRVRVKRELEDGWSQWLSMPLPALVTVQSGQRPLRYATLKGIMAAKKKEIRVVTATLPREASEIVSLRLPSRRKATRVLTGPPAEVADELVRRLKDEARVL